MMATLDIHVYASLSSVSAFVASLSSVSAFDIEACVHRCGQGAHDIGKYAGIFLSAIRSS